MAKPSIERQPILFSSFFARIKLGDWRWLLFNWFANLDEGGKESLERDSGLFLFRLVTSFIRALLRLVVIEIVAKLTKIEQLKRSEEVGNTATEKNLVCICVWLWGGD